MLYPKLESTEFCRDKKWNRQWVRCEKWHSRGIIFGTREPPIAMTFGSLQALSAESWIPRNISFVKCALSFANLQFDSLQLTFAPNICNLSFHASPQSSETLEFGHLKRWPALWLTPRRPLWMASITGWSMAAAYAPQRRPSVPQSTRSWAFCGTVIMVVAVSGSSSSSSSSK